MSSFWSGWIIVLTLGNIAACWWLIRWTMRPKANEAGEGDVTGHSWDGLQEFNNPLPRWWLWLFYLTMVFSLVYLVLYPGLGSFKGVLNWTSHNQWDAEMADADAEYGPIFAQYANQDVETLAGNADAVGIGRRLFLNYCAACHGSDAEGARGFPNLTDNDWLYGGSGATIEQTIANGRNGFMPPMAAALGDNAGVENVANYVLSLSGRKHDSSKAAEGKASFETVCGACHMPTGAGNQAIGAPNLTDNVWLYGAAKSSVVSAIKQGHKGTMPAHLDFLGKDKVHLLATYVYSLSANK
ncbi:MAG: cytochrome-c oxidase, cbb3-type subunit III [bacterium]